MNSCELNFNIGLVIDNLMKISTRDLQFDKKAGDREQDEGFQSLKKFIYGHSCCSW